LLEQFLTFHYFAYRFHRPIPIHLSRPLHPPPPPGLLEGLQFSHYGLTHGLTGSLASSQPPAAPDPTGTAVTRPTKPLWNPALDLTVTPTERSPRKGDTAESLPMVICGEPGDAAHTTGAATEAEHHTTSDSSPPLTENTSSVRTAPQSQPKQQQQQQQNSSSPGFSAILEDHKRIKPAFPGPVTAPSSTDTPMELKTPSQQPERDVARKRKETASPAFSSKQPQKRLIRYHDQHLHDKNEKILLSDGKDCAVSEEHVQRNHHLPHLNVVGGVGGVGGVGCITTDSQNYQNFHHQRRLALLASNLLQMNAHNHQANLLASPHQHLLPQLQHNPHRLPYASVLPQHPGLSLHNALALVQSREVLERLSASSAFSSHLSSPGSTCHQHRHPHPVTDNIPTISTSQLSHPAHTKLPQKECHPAASSSSSAPFLPHHPKTDKVHQPPPLTLQNALVLAQSRALMERVTAGQILPTPALTVDPLLSNHHPQPNILSPHVPHGGPSPIGAGSIGSAAGIGMAAGVGGVTGGPGGGGGGGGYGRKLFPCPQCRYTTDRRNNLKRHMLTMHQTSSKMLECCGILFSTKASLREHAMIFHYHGYTCYFCGRRFCRKALLKRHLSVHNGQKDFVCTVCDYATSHKSNLERHRKVHSRQDGDEGRDGEDGDVDGSGSYPHRYHDDMKSNGSEAVSHEDVSEDELSVCSDFDDDTD
ncbi:Zinc finger protein, partial [Plakobranchus ocellatus]